MNENMVKTELRFDTDVKVEFVTQKSMDDSTTVMKECVALYFGKSDPHHDAVLSFPSGEVLIQMYFSGQSDVTFQQKQEVAHLSPCKLKKTYFLFITNEYRNEKEQESLVHARSMFVNQQRWKDTFSPMFEFIIY
jgi:hypothetical protein